MGEGERSFMISARAYDYSGFVAGHSTAGFPVDTAAKRKIPFSPRPGKNRT
jgi:hypothetical protein